MRLVGLPALEAHFRCARVDCDDVSAIEKLRTVFQRACAVVVLKKIGIDEPVGRRKGCAGDTVELVDFGHAAIDLGGCERLDRMAEFALERDVLDGAREGLLVVEPEVTLLPEADFVAHALVVLDRRAAQRDVHPLPPGGAHAARILFAGAETSAEIDIDGERFEPALRQTHRDRTADDTSADNDRLESLTRNHEATLSKSQS